MRTLFDKIWDMHLVGQRADGRDLLYIDRHVVHELHAPHAFADLQKSGRSVRRKDLTIVVQDHTVPTRPGVPLGSSHIDATRIGAKKYGVRLIDVAEPEHGIVHVVAPELGIALPGLTLACPDSHASITAGAWCCHSLSVTAEPLESTRLIGGLSAIIAASSWASPSS